MGLSGFEHRVNGCGVAIGNEAARGRSICMRPDHGLSAASGDRLAERVGDRLDRARALRAAIDEDGRARA